MKKILHFIFNFLILFPAIILLYQPISRSTTGHLMLSLVFAIIGSRLKLLPNELLRLYHSLHSKSFKQLFWIYYLLTRILLAILIVYILFPGKSKTNLEAISFYFYFFIFITYDILLSIILWRKTNNKKKPIKYIVRAIIINSIIGGIFGFFK